VGALFRGACSDRISVFAGGVLAALWIAVRAGAVSMDGARGGPLSVSDSFWVGDFGGPRCSGSVLRLRDNGFLEAPAAGVTVAGDRGGRGAGDPGDFQSAGDEVLGPMVPAADDPHLPAVPICCGRA